MEADGGGLFLIGHEDGVEMLGNKGANRKEKRLRVGRAGGGEDGF